MRALLLCTMVLLCGCDRIFVPPYPAERAELEGVRSPVDFGKVRVGERSTWDFSARNLRDEAVVVDMRGRPPFHVEPGEPFLLEPGEVRPLRIVFEPTEPGPFVGFVGLKLQHNIKVIRVTGEAFEPCDDRCGLLTGFACMPRREGEPCAGETACSEMGLCSAGRCVVPPRAQGSACVGECGEGQCADGICQPGGRATAPDWTFSRQGEFQITHADDERILVLQRWNESHATPMTLRPDGVLLTVTADAIPLGRADEHHLFAGAIAVRHGDGWRGWDLQTGKLRWRRDAGGSTSVSDGERIYLAHGNTVEAFFGDSGEPAWNAPVTGRQLLRAGEMLHVVGLEGVHALDAASGAVRWSWEAGGMLLDRSAWADGMLVVARIWRDTGAAELVALDDGGRVRWRVETASGHGAGLIDTPVQILDGLVFRRSGEVNALEDGSFRYRIPVEGRTPQLAFGGTSAAGFEYLCTGEAPYCGGRVVGFRAADGEVLYRRPVGPFHYDLAAREDGTVATWPPGGTLQCILDPGGAPVGLEGSVPASDRTQAWAGAWWITVEHDERIDRSTLRGYHVPAAGGGAAPRE